MSNEIDPHLPARRSVYRSHQHHLSAGELLAKGALDDLAMIRIQTVPLERGQILGQASADHRCIGIVCPAGSPRLKCRFIRGQSIAFHAYL